MGIRSRGGSVPAGTVVDYAGGAVLGGWLLCYGQVVSRAEYAGLFAAIGTTYGAGDGSTTFNIPDSRGRFTAGLDNMGGVAANRITSAVSGVDGGVLGGVGGGQSVTLTESEMPSHTHGISDTANLSASGPQPRAQAGDVRLSGASGGSGAHRNVPPVLMVNKIIKC